QCEYSLFVTYFLIVIFVFNLAFGCSFPGFISALSPPPAGNAAAPLRGIGDSSAAMGNAQAKDAARDMAVTATAIQMDIPSWCSVAERTLALLVCSFPITTNCKVL